MKQCPRSRNYGKDLMKNGKIMKIKTTQSNTFQISSSKVLEIPLTVSNTVVYVTSEHPTFFGIFKHNLGFKPLGWFCKATILSQVILPVNPACVYGLAVQFLPLWLLQNSQPSKMTLK